MIKEKFIFINSKGQSVELGNAAPFILLNHEGTGGARTDVQMRKLAFQDGQTFTGANYSERPITLSFLIKAQSQEELFRNRALISQVLNSMLGLGTLQYDFGSGILEIDAVVENGPTFPSGESNRDNTFQVAVVDLICPSPFFRKLEIQKTEIALWESNFEFPLEIPLDGIEMGIRSPSLIVNVQNDGQVPIGLIIKFKALGTVRNPSLFNVNTREWFKLNRIMTAGEVITVNTNQGKKRVESTKNGVVSNIFNNMVFGSNFLQLDIGDNLFRYDADENLDALEVDIYHTPQYAGV
ncbi:phage tail family protein [Cytobacillus depressus]|uniref:Phage tail family protein n=1 Tax=Cytobacillus depressus TaxID=1602942 RepID=A0A6L3VAU7_9BACI|nr:phage tail family protein [Cytobacillus depressus]KAB2337659.1 phage tail family protein [Cytobacillus depressus]